MACADKDTPNVCAPENSIPSGNTISTLSDAPIVAPVFHTSTLHSTVEPITVAPAGFCLKDNVPKAAAAAFAFIENVIVLILSIFPDATPIETAPAAATPFVTLTRESNVSATAGATAKNVIETLALPESFKS